MTINATSVFRVRTGGNNANGGGYDSGISGTLSTTLNGAISSSVTTVVVTSATGWPGSGNYYARIGNIGGETAGGSSEVVLVTGGQGTTSWTVTRAQLGTTALAFATGVVVDNDLSRCNTAPLSGSVGTSTASTTFIDVTATFDLTCVGNTIFLTSGTGVTTGCYFIQSRTNATTVVLDRASGTYTVGVWKMGGAWTGDFRSVCLNTWIKPGNLIYMRASGSGTVASPDYTWADYFNPPTGDTTNGMVRFIGENGRPIWASSSGLFMQSAAYDAILHVYMAAKGNTYGQGFIDSNSTVYMYDVVVDQVGHDIGLGTGLGLSLIADSCEVFSSVANSGAAGASYGIDTPSGKIIGCNVHDCWGGGINMGNFVDVSACLVAFNRGSGINVANASYNSITFCTIDSNHGSGINIAGAFELAICTIEGNIISNHTTASTYGIAANFNSQAANDRIRGSIDCNAYYNNASNAQNLTVGTTIVNGFQLHDTVGVDPQYSSTANENYAIGTNLVAKGYPQTPYINAKSGTSAPTSYVDSGGVQRQAGGASTSYVINRITNLFLVDGDSSYAP